MIEYIQFFYRMLFSGLMHENPMRCICTHPWLQLALWGRCLCDLSWWVCSTQKHWVCGSPCNSYPVCTAADAALDIKLTFHWISLFLFALLFLLHGILHQSASVVHLIFFIPMSPSSLGLNLYIVLFFHSFLSSFLSSFFLLFFFFFSLFFSFLSTNQTENCLSGRKTAFPLCFYTQIYLKLRSEHEEPIAILWLSEALRKFLDISSCKLFFSHSQSTVFPVFHLVKFFRCYSVFKEC